MRRGTLLSFILLFLLVTILQAEAQVNVLTCHNDNARTGLNPNEKILSPATVNSNSFGKLFSLPVDGPVYAQPLYVSNVQIPNKGTHNVVFVATQHDSVYAFDADSNTGSNAVPLWRRSFINPAAGITAVPASEAAGGPNCQTFVGEVGIVGTPAIDAASQTLYVVARTKEPLPPPNNQTIVQVQRLHALDITTGNERSNSPVAITASVPGTGAGSSGGFVQFNPFQELQRPGLLLVGGVVYLSWCSYCDIDPYHGWIIGYDAQTLQQVAVFNTTPNATRGGIWMGGAGLAADASGAIYCITGNGTFDTVGTPQNFGDSFLKLTQGANLTLADYFTPFNQATMDSADEDLGSSGALVIPDSVGNASHPHLLVGCSKLGKMYLIDRDNMGHFNAANDSQIVQVVQFFSSQPGSPHFFGAPAFFNNRLYVQGVGEPLKAYAFTNGLINAAPISQGLETLAFRGATPSISADGTTNGIVWEVAPYNTLSPGLQAYNAENLSQKLYDSFKNFQAGQPDQLTYIKFVVPTIANGKVYLGTTDSLAVFGLHSKIKSITRNAISGTVQLVFTGPPGTTVQVSGDIVQWTDLGTGTPIGTGTFTFSDSAATGQAVRFYRLR
jgi:hypothetical protein